MQWQGAVPDRLTHSAMISAYEKGKRPKQAVLVFHAMQCQQNHLQCKGLGLTQDGIGRFAGGNQGLAYAAC